MSKLKPVSADPSRETLRKAIEERNAAKDVCARADLAERNGEELVRSAEANLATFDNIDEAIVAHRADKFKRAATGGPAPDTALPDELTKRRRARDESRDMLAAARSARASLVAELEAAQKTLQRAEHKVSEAAGAILAAEAVRLAGALRTAWATTWFLHDVLSALPLPLPRDAVDVCQEIVKFDYRQFPGGRNAARARAGEDWRTWSAALSEDADAQPLKFDDGPSSAAVERVA